MEAFLSCHQVGGGFGAPQQSQGLAGFISGEASNANEADGNDGASGRGGGKASAQTLTPVTIRMLLDAAKDRKGLGPDANFSVNGRELGMVTIVACVDQVKHQQMGLCLTLNDGSGKIECNFYQDQDAGNCEFKQLDYVRVLGNLRHWEGKENLNAIHVGKVETANEIAYHGIEVAHVQLSIMGKLVKATPGNAPRTQGPGLSLGQASTPQSGMQSQQPQEMMQQQASAMQQSLLVQQAPSMQQQGSAMQAPPMQQHQGSHMQQQGFAMQQQQSLGMQQQNPAMQQPPPMQNQWQQPPQASAPPPGPAPQGFGGTMPQSGPYGGAAGAGPYGSMPPPAPPGGAQGSLYGGVNGGSNTGAAGLFGAAAGPGGY